MPKPYILVVEDSDDIRDLIGQFFTYEGFACELVENGRLALAKLYSAEVLPAVILLDLMMPDMDGVEFCKQKQNDNRLAEIPVVMMTADSNAVSRSRQAGAKEFIRKPLELDTLLDIAHRYLSPPEGL